MTHHVMESYLGAVKKLRILEWAKLSHGTDGLEFADYKKMNEPKGDTEDTNVSNQIENDK